jgi:hypothetical protein
LGIRFGRFFHKRIGSLWSGARYHKRLKSIHIKRSALVYHLCSGKFVAKTLKAGSGHRSNKFWLNILTTCKWLTWSGWLYNLQSCSLTSYVIYWNQFQNRPLVFVTYFGLVSYQVYVYIHSNYFESANILILTEKKY